MLTQDVRDKIKNITSGAVINGQPGHCTAIRNLLCSRYPPDRTVKTNFEGKSVTKEEQSALIASYCDEHNLWMQPPGDYLTRGGEARVYLDPDAMDVIKVNGGVYYATWLEFFNSILLHNVLFENTAYTLIGFYREEGQIYAMLKQPYVECNRTVEIAEIKTFLEFNGFINTRRQDYVNKELGLILEDMHDENVLLCDRLLFFVDSVFYVIEPDMEPIE